MATSEDVFSPRGDGTSSLYSIPLSTTGTDGKAAIFQVADEKGTALISANSATGATTIGGLTATSATLVTPVLGTPTSGNLENCTLAYAQVPLPKIGYKTATVTAADAAWVDGGGAVGTFTLTGVGIPAGAVILGTKVIVTAGFAGDVSATLTIGDGTDADRYMTGTPSIFATAATGIQTGVPSGDKLILTVNSPVLTVTGSSDWGLVAAGGGSMSVTIYYIWTV